MDYNNSNTIHVYFQNDVLARRHRFLESRDDNIMRREAVYVSYQPHPPKEGHFSPIGRIGEFRELEVEQLWKGEL